MTKKNKRKYRTEYTVKIIGGKIYVLLFEFNDNGSQTDNTIASFKLQYYIVISTERLYQDCFRT